MSILAPYIQLIAQICTELLYQPLTLLDCLHTFCGSCVKEWFSAQASRRTRHSQFTCPSCRAEVRDTRPNATVTTLLDMVLGPHPDRARSTDEKAEIAQRYTHGESVFPTVPSGGESADDDGEDDERLLEEVRDLSLRESRAQVRRETRRTTHSSRTRESSHVDRHTEDGRSRRRREERTLRPDDPDRSRRVEHQSSLRSLLSLSSDAETMEEEILRQILEDGLLDDINLDNLGPRQEEELSERIAEAYRRRHMRQSRSGQRQGQSQDQRQESDVTSRTQTRSESTQRTNESTPATREPNDRRPPVSRPHLLNSAPTRPSISGHQRRNSEQGGGRRRTSPVRTNQASASDDAIRPAVRSSSDMTADRTHMSQTGRLRSESSSARPRGATESEQNAPSAWTAGGRERSSSRQITGQSTTSSPITATVPSTQSHHSTDHNLPSMSSPLVPNRSDRRTRPTSSRSNVSASPTIKYAEPSISCDGCGKTEIQYDLHKRCPVCKDGNFHLCLRCYRLGRGCLRWSGFGASADISFQRMIASSTRRPAQISEPGHVLVWLKYQRPPDTAHIAMSGERQLTVDNPARRLQSGLFCDTCQSSANDCFWECSKCNEGDWGFCNSCVNQGRCCTHALLPVRRIAHSPPPSVHSSTTQLPFEASTIPPAPSEIETFKILSFSTNCDICTYPIPASNTRYHCLECNGGDYDVCTNCYLKLVATGKISKENGHNGWRRCLASHRMITVGFEDHEEGQRRVIVRDLVGGRALKDEHVTQSQSPTVSPATGGPVASPELGTGDWSWKEGPERRKKASRLRTGPMANAANGGLVSASDLSNAPGNSTASPTQGTPPFRRFPPDGGVGLIVHAIWSWYPEEDVEDELVFPRGADITEAENINDDWFWGCYAGRTGLFPGPRVKLVREVFK
jgi:hypothetical protein